MFFAFHMLLSLMALCLCQCGRRLDANQEMCFLIEIPPKGDAHETASVSVIQRVGKRLGLLPTVKDPIYALVPMQLRLFGGKKDWLATRIKHDKHGFVLNSRDQRTHCTERYSHLDLEELHANRGFMAQPPGEKKKQYIDFYHGTSQESVANILQYGFLVQRHKYRRKLKDDSNLAGAGFYLSDTVNKADQYVVPLTNSSPSLFPVLQIGIEKTVVENKIAIYLWRSRSQNEYFARIEGEDDLHNGKKELLKRLRNSYRGRMMHLLSREKHEEEYAVAQGDVIDAFERKAKQLPKALTWKPVLIKFDEFVFTAELIERIYIEQNLRLQFVAYYKRCKKNESDTIETPTPVDPYEPCEALTCG
eukprot:TRINITY_DN66495_c0_g1_i1.p1 TRINITY_DN66495_c0_g1~~TRINITY_DN66495_c0_g1_i1.p1  ORF type:complete len:362 (-),score=32.01 TRINITY_DN66495_c0_g1_i1:335-1420(-)